MDRRLNTSVDVLFHGPLAVGSFFRTQVFDACLPGRRLGDRPVLSKRQRRTQRKLERDQAGGWDSTVGDGGMDSFYFSFIFQDF